MPTLDQIMSQLSSRSIREVKTSDAVDAIVEDLRNRGGLGDEWDGLDSEMRKEIMKDWYSIVKEAYDAFPS